MFGISLPKLLLLVVVAVGAWYGFKWLQQQRIGSLAEAWEKLRNQFSPQPPAAPPKSEETVLCKICGAYVVARDPTACGRTDCPFPRRS